MGGRREKAVVGANFMFFANRAGPCSLDPGVSACFLQGDIVFSQPRDGDWINKQELHPSFHLFFVSSGKMEDEAEIMCGRKCLFQGCHVRLLMRVPRMRCANLVCVPSLQISDSRSGT